MDPRREWRREGGGAVEISRAKDRASSLLFFSPSSSQLFKMTEQSFCSSIGKYVNGDGGWNAGTFGCFGKPKGPMACVCAYFCPCLVAGQTAKEAPWPCYKGKNAGTLSFITDCVCFGFFVGFILAVVTRGRYRQAKGISGDMGSDCLCMWCCPCCTLSQQYQQTADIGK